MNPMIPGFGLILLAAVSGGVVAFPLRVQRRYAWENTWFLLFSVATIIIPFTMLKIFLPVWPSAVAAAGTRTVLCAAAFGFLWGWGCVTLAVGVTAVGLSLGYATIMGLNVAIGSIIPMIRKWDQVPGDARTVVLLGIALCVAGVGVCGRAGMLRERGSAGGTGSTSDPSQSRALKVFLIGLAWCALSGFLSGCVNLGFDFADKVAQEAQRLGAGPTRGFSWPLDHRLLGRLHRRADWLRHPDDQERNLEELCRERLGTRFWTRHSRGLLPLYGADSLRHRRILPGPAGYQRGLGRQYRF